MDLNGDLHQRRLRSTMHTRMEEKDFGLGRLDHAGGAGTFYFGPSPETFVLLGLPDSAFQHAVY